MYERPWPESLQTLAGAAEPSLQSLSVAQRAPAQLVPPQLARHRLIGPRQTPAGVGDPPALQSPSTVQGLPMQRSPPFSVQPGRHFCPKLPVPMPLV